MRLFCKQIVLLIGVIFVGLWGVLVASSSLSAPLSAIAQQNKDDFAAGLDASLVEWQTKITTIARDKGSLAVSDILATATNSLPLQIQDFLTAISIGSVLFKKAEQVIAQDALVMEGVATVGATRYPVSVMAVKEGDGAVKVSLKVSIPSGLAQKVTSEAFFSFAAIKNPFLIISTISAYDDAQLGIPINPGVTIVGTVSAKDSGLKDSLSLAGSFFKGTVSLVTVVVQVAFSGEGSGYVSVPERSLNVHTAVKASNYITSSGWAIPVSVKTFFDTLTFSLKDLVVKLGKDEKKIIAKGLATFGANSAQATITFLHDENKQRVGFLQLENPSIDLAVLLPQLTSLVGTAISQLSLTFASKEYKDVKSDIVVHKGVTVQGMVPTALLKEQPVVAELAKIVPSIPDMLALEWVIQERIQDASIQLSVPYEAGSGLSLGSLFDWEALSIPNALYKDLVQLTMSAPQIAITLQKDIKYATGKGTVSYKNSIVEATVKFVADEKNSLTSVLFLRVNPTWKFSDTFSELKSLDLLSLKDVVLVIASSDYRDIEFDRTFKKGLNVVSAIDLAGPLVFVKTLIADHLKRIATDIKLDKLVFHGVIGTDIQQADFSVFIPVYLGVNFSELHRKGILKGPAPDVTSLTIDGLRLAIKGDASVGITSSLRLNLGSQSEPLLFAVTLGTAPTKCFVEGAMDGVWKDAFKAPWLDVQDLGIALDFDYVLLASGLPSGIGLRGKLVVDKATGNAIDVAIKAEVSSSSVGRFAFSGKADRLALHECINLLLAITKQPILRAQLPPIEFSDVELKLIPQDTLIAGKSYKQGVISKASFSLFGLQGALDFSIDNKGFKGSGSLEPFKVASLHISGVQEGKGPSIIVEISQTAQKIAANAQLKTSLLGGFSSQVDLSFSPEAIQFATNNVALFNQFMFDLSFRLSVLEKGLSQSYIKGAMKQQGLETLSQLVKIAAREFLEEAHLQIERDLQLAHTDVAEASKKVQEAKDVVQKGVEDEVGKAQRRIDELEKLIQDSNEKCKKESGINKLVVCAKEAGNRIGYYVELGALKVWVEGALKAGSSVAQESLDVATKAVEKGHDVIDLGGNIGKISVESIKKSADLFATGVGQIFNIQEFTFEGDDSELQKDMLPKVKIKGVFFGQQLDLENIEIDFGYPAKAALEIVEQAIKKLEAVKFKVEQHMKVLP